MAVASGGVRLSRLRLHERQVHLAARTSDGFRERRTAPSICKAAFESREVAVMSENQPKVKAGVSLRQRRLAGAIRSSACSARSGRFFRAGYHANHLVSSWLPALDGVAAKLEHGATVARRWLWSWVLDHRSWRRLSRNRRSSATTFIPRLGVEQARVHAEQAWSDGEHKVRSRHGERFSGQGPRPRDLLRLPA